MPKPSINVEQVVAALRTQLPTDLHGYDLTKWAIEKLLAAGIRPTNESIRSVLSHGSPNTLKVHADKYFRENTKPLAAPSDAVSVLQQHYYEQLREIITAEIERDLADQRAAIALAQQQADQTLRDAQIMQAGTHEAMKVLQSQLTALQQQVARLPAQLSPKASPAEHPRSLRAPKKQRA